MALNLNQISRFSVTGFFIASGYGLTVSKKYSLNYFIFLKQRLIKLLPAYFIWTIIYTFVAGKINIFILLKNTILGTSSYHMYYIVVLVFFYVIYPIPYRICRTKWGILVALIITLFSQVLALITGLSILKSGLNVFNWLFFFSFGIFIADSKHYHFILNHRKSTELMVIASLILVLASSYMGNLYNIDLTTAMRPTVLFYSTTFACLIVALPVRSSKFVNVVSQNSYQFYLSHALILTIFAKLMSIYFSDINLNLLIILLFVLVSSGALLVSICIKQIVKWIKYFMLQLT